MTFKKLASNEYHQNHLSITLLILISIGHIFLYLCYRFSEYLDEKKQYEKLLNEIEFIETTEYNMYVLETLKKIDLIMCESQKLIEQKHKLHMENYSNLLNEFNIGNCENKIKNNDEIYCKKNTTEDIKEKIEDNIKNSRDLKDEIIHKIDEMNIDIKNNPDKEIIDEIAGNKEDNMNESKTKKSYPSNITTNL